MKHLLVALVPSPISLALLCILLLSVAPRTTAGAQSQPASTYVGSQACADCHGGEWDDFRKSIHFQTDAPGQWDVGGCESCHGPGSTHVETTGETPMIFGDNQLFTSQQKTDQCLSCHEGRETSFAYRSADHPTGMVDCASCHRTHEATLTDMLQTPVRTARADARAGISGHQACLQCHQEIRTSANLVSRHRIEEGMVQCSDCHEQHRPSGRTQLGGFQQESCFACHTDKRGPFVYEHQASRVEGCTSCHVPHGSPNRHMLQYQSVADQCYACHVVVPGFHKGFPGAPVRFDSTSVCTNCHSTIHGSNLDRFFLR